MLKLLCDLEKISDIINKLGINYINVGKIQVDGLEFVVDEKQRFYFSESDGITGKSFDVLEMTREEVWKLDKYQACLYYKKDEKHIEEFDLIVYKKRDVCFDDLVLETPEEISGYCAGDLQLKFCDIYLMIPGKIDQKKFDKSYYRENNHPLFSLFKENIEQSINSEYSSSFLKDMDRYFLFETTLRIKGEVAEDCFYQRGLVGCVVHPTGFCVLEIMVPCCVFGGNKFLTNYCGETIEIKYSGEYYRINELFEKIGIRRFGKKRSMVFSYGDTTKEEIINALANEEFPMGKIDGDFFQSIATRNIAQYDTARVFVSSETVIESCSYVNVFLDKRILYHVIEIFFVEMILLQDASIDKIHIDLLNICNGTELDVDFALKRSEEINYDMTLALKFADYNYFLFPTVRESAKTIAKAFDIDHIYEKYDHDKYLIDSIIKSNERKLQEKQDRIKNRFLFFISALTTIGMLGEIIHVFFEDAYTSAYSYMGALVVSAIFYVAYKIVLKMKK